MTRPLVSDDLWAIVAPLLPSKRPKLKGGLPPLDDRKALAGILFVLRSGIPREMLPPELGCGSGMTCWRRLRDWHEAGVWARLHRALLDRLGAADQIDWSRACLDSAAVPAKKGGAETDPNPTDRGKPGTKCHVVVDRQGTPLAALISPANHNDSVLLAPPALDAVPPIRRSRGRPRRRPTELCSDKSYDHGFCRADCRKRSVQPRIARRGIDSSQRLGRHRCEVERTLAWLNRFRRLTIRYERRADIHQVFLTLGCALICFQQLQRFC